MKTCSGCGDKKMRYCFCLKCGWMSPEDKKRNEEVRKKIEEKNFGKPDGAKIKTVRMDWSKFCDSRVLPER